MASPEVVILATYTIGVVWWIVGSLLLFDTPLYRQRYMSVSVIWPVIAIPAIGWALVSAPGYLARKIMKGTK